MLQKAIQKGSVDDSKWWLPRKMKDDFSERTQVQLEDLTPEDEQEVNLNDAPIIVMRMHAPTTHHTRVVLAPRLRRCTRPGTGNAGVRGVRLDLGVGNGDDASLRAADDTARGRPTLRGAMAGMSLMLCGTCDSNMIRYK